MSFRRDWWDLLAVQGTLKSLLQHHSSKASILWCSAFFLVQLSHPYWKNHSFDYVLSRFSHVRLFATPWTVAHQAPLSMGFSRHEYWNGLPLPSPGTFVGKVMSLLFNMLSRFVFAFLPGSKHLLISWL